VPAWTVNGAVQSSPLSQGYATIRRTWQAGDVVELDLPLIPQRVLSHANVEPNRDRVAVIRGPLVYCAEGADHDGHVLDRVLPDHTRLTANHRPDLLGGVTVLTGAAQVLRRLDDGTTRLETSPLTLIPYYAWCHRGANEMQVWMPRTADRAVAPPRPTMASCSKPSASHTHDGDSVRALNDQREPSASDDHGVPRHTWWDHRGTSEWVQYDLDRPREVSAVDLYWFDDTGRGACRVPASWKLLYRSRGQWQAVQTAGPYGLTRDQYNRLTFSPVTADALRVEVALQPGFSGGVLEWKVE
jgi:hypothetical protein